MAGHEAEGDWVLDSLDRYEQLHVFELQEPTRCMEWSPDITALYVAGFSLSRHNELLQLLLPEKLLAADKQTLLARRDFRIGRGAICREAIHHIQCVDLAGNVLITSGLGSGLKMWGPDPSSPDLLVATRDVATPTPTLGDPDRTELQVSSQPHTLLTGSSLHTLQLLDLHTFCPTWQCPRDAADALLHALTFLPRETKTFLTCSGRGGLTVWDSRQAGGAMKFSMDPLLKEPPSEDSKQPVYAMVVCDNGRKCAYLSGTGHLQLHDLRGGASRQSLATCQLPTRAQSSLWSHFTSQKTAVKPCVQFSESSSQLSVSGLDRGVTVYDITAWSNTVDNPSPIFTHFGHEADTPQCEVTVHSWHPSFHSMILSCDSNGTMHAWQWNDGH